MTDDELRAALTEAIDAMKAKEQMMLAPPRLPVDAELEQDVAIASMPPSLAVASLRAEVVPATRRARNENRAYSLILAILLVVSEILHFLQHQH